MKRETKSFWVLMAVHMAGIIVSGTRDMVPCWLFLTFGGIVGAACGHLSGRMPLIKRSEITKESKGA